ncbi:MAG TPA: hypothetical protein VK907_04000, partial [Phnomibacter sp.]|nr:hypothetical protein [Phnomibacter sp.]
MDKPTMMQQQEYVFVNGVFYKKEEAAISVADLALLRGYGIFDFFMLANGLPLFFEDHWQRLNHSARSMDLAVP